MVVKGTLLYLEIRYCGYCGERKKVPIGVNHCPEPNCGQRLRTKPRRGDQKEKYITFQGY